MHDADNSSDAPEPMRQNNVDTHIHPSVDPVLPEFVNIDSGAVKCVSHNPHFLLR
jgi:hypothetical protein